MTMRMAWLARAVRMYDQRNCAMSLSTFRVGRLCMRNFLHRDIARSGIPESDT